MVDEFQEGFQADGTLRDIYVLQTRNEDWDKFLEFVRSSYRTEFLVGENSRDLPSEAANVFDEWAVSPVLLKIFVGAVQINCHFFTKNEIELDLAPEEVKTSEQGELIMEFLKALGVALQRPVRLTAESDPDDVIFEYQPGEDRPRYHSPLERYR